MKFLWFALVAVVLVAAHPTAGKSSDRPEADDGKISTPFEPGCIGNYQPCIESTKPCCRLEDRTSVRFGREEYICQRFLGGLCAPLEVISNLTLYIELSRRLNETNLAELSNLYSLAVMPTPGMKPEPPKILNAGNVEEALKQSTGEMEMSADTEREPDKSASRIEDELKPDKDSPTNNNELIDARRGDQGYQLEPGMTDGHESNGKW
uniref:CcIV 1.0 protein n=1 Tax=Campoletis chlorideae ichnovirus TaxID=219164 RepID=Q80S75_9VIRU|nr:CcIV 1.0 protein [Campoletis chlorideae ichnovirus]